MGVWDSVPGLSNTSDSELGPAGQPWWADTILALVELIAWESVVVAVDILGLVPFYAVGLESPAAQLSLPHPVRV